MNPFQVPLYLDYVATFAWAASGAIVGIRARFDLTGVFVLALLSAVGGSLLRDGLFLHRPPPVVTNPVYLPLIVVATLLIAVYARQLRQPLDWPAADNLVLMIDSLGTPAFAVVGMQLALDAGVSLPGVLLVGVVNGTAGGLIRDVLVNEQPMLLRPGRHFTSLLILACTIYLVLTLYVGLQSFWVGWGVAFSFLAARWLAVRYDVRTRPLGE